MKIEKQHTYEKVILGLQLIGFATVIAVLWLDEFVDVPHSLFGAHKTPLRPQEFWFEALTVLLVATGVVIGNALGFSTPARFGKLHPGLRLVPESERGRRMGFV